VDPTLQAAITIVLSGAMRAIPTLNCWACSTGALVKKA
jgi:hypothetical protein